MRDARCKRCPLYKEAKTVCLWGHGKKGGIMLVGEAPGAVEDRTGLPFQGDAGQILDERLAAAGIKRSDVWVTNANKCRPPGNRTPLPTEVAACLPYLAEEIADVKPKVIIAIGGSALQSLTDLKAVGANRGKVLSAGKLRTEAPVLVTWHPAASLHNPRERDKMMGEILDDLRMAQAIVAGSENVDSRRLVYAGEKDKLYQALREIARAEDYVVDCEWLASTETDALVWPWDKRSKFLSLAIAAQMPDGSVSNVGIQWDPSYKSMLQAFFDTRPLTFHNAMADLIWLFALGFDIKLGGDTLLWAYLLDEEQRLALDQLAPLLAGVAPGWKKPVWRQSPATRAEWKMLLDYNCDDTYATLRLKQALRKRTARVGREERTNIARCYSRLLLPAVPTFARIALAGTSIDQDGLGAAIIERQTELGLAEEAVAKIANVPLQTARRLAGSPQQTAAFMRGSYGLELPNSTKQELGRYVNQFPVIKEINRFRHERKLIGTYLEPWERILGNSHDGRLHSVYRLASTRTGRTSAELEEGGSLQLAPREQWVRQLIEARPGWQIVAADYSQIELRMIAWLGPEKTMRRLYNEGADLHTATAAYIKAFEARKMTVAEFWPQRHKWMADVTKQERQDAKPVNFGFCYGMQVPGFIDYVANNYGIVFNEKQATTARTGYFTLYDDLDPWHQRVERNEYYEQLTLTPTGRYRRKLGALTEAINTPIQGTASDFTMFAQVVIEEILLSEGLMRLDKYLGNTGMARLIGMVHDSVLLEVKDGVVDEVKSIVKETMENLPLKRLGIGKLPIPLVADVAAGPTWGDAH